MVRESYRTSSVPAKTDFFALDVKVKKALDPSAGAAAIASP